WNLLANSIKFSPRGSEVRLRLCADERDVTLRVQDDGIGIEPAFLPHVFERFRQADGTYARAHGGVGLGLAIVRHLVEAHGGTVTAESAGVGSGSTFVVTIPRARGERPDAPRVEPREAEAVPRPVPAGPLARLDGVSVLAVDDDADTLNAMEIILASQGADVTTARSVAAAREAILRVRPHVVLCDIGMPDEDGYALLEWLRAFSASSGERMATVAVTAYAAEADRSRALAAGFDAYLPKPLHPDDVVRLVARVGAPTEVRRD
ncbi:MAG TPA: ATP-binding protein, partial [Vicinamibacteria bacterium]|nr:ATP-binding protein [Vicinamibacteria bacterium]